MFVNWIYFDCNLSLAGLSPEEERLWSIVRTNSLDFNAWTALIEETEKVAEVVSNDSLNFYTIPVFLVQRLCPVFSIH